MLKKLMRERTFKGNFFDNFIYLASILFDHFISEQLMTLELDFHVEQQLQSAEFQEQRFNAM
jgi:hypothetical protein